MCTTILKLIKTIVRNLKQLKHFHKADASFFGTFNVLKSYIEPRTAEFNYEGKSISKLQMDIELKQIRGLI
jgi:hypothetical protein